MVMAEPERTLKPARTDVVLAELTKPVRLHWQHGVADAVAHASKSLEVGYAEELVRNMPSSGQGPPGPDEHIIGKSRRLLARDPWALSCPVESTQHRRTRPVEHELSVRRDRHIAVLQRLDGALTVEDPGPADLLHARIEAFAAPVLARSLLVRRGLPFLA